MKNIIIVLFILVGTCISMYANEKVHTNNELLDKVNKETLERRRGLSLGVKMSSANDAQINIMYNIPISTLEQEVYFNRQPQGQLIGIGLLLGSRGYKDYFLDEILKDKPETYAKIGLKLDTSYPITMNYISITGYIAPFFNFIILDNNDNLSGIDFGFEVGSDINVWLDNMTCIYTGFMMDPSITRVYGDEELANPLTYKITFGAKSYF